MEDGQKYRILVAQTNTDLLARCEKLLTSEGYQVGCFESSSAIFSELETSRKNPYAVAIICYKMLEMKGDEILKKIKELSPDTRRILITDTLNIDITIKAINDAEIFSCLSLPFSDEDILGQADHACRQFQAIQKRQNLIRVTQRQNKQLYKIAKLFKEKDGKYIEKLEKQKKRLRLLESKAKQDKKIRKSISLKDVIKEKNITPAPENFANELLILKIQMREILEKATGGSIEINDLAYSKIKDQPVTKRDEVNKIMNLSFMLLKSTAFLGINALEAVQGGFADERNIEIILSEDKIKAYIKLKTFNTSGINVITIKESLKQKGIRAGIKDDGFIKSWLLGADPEDDPIVIAKGREPKLPRNAEIKYHFPLEFRNPGKVDAEGRIDFKERGKIPFVEKDTCLAAKIFPEDGVPGMDVTGETIPVDDAVDMAFGLGTGVRASEDGVKIYADMDGQPSIDPLGNISVFPELKIDGDIGLESGNVNFDGNITVTGVIKNGFKVKGASLTVEQIEGAEVDLTGDLNVSLGIVDANLIRVKGNIQAKYVNNSKIYGFGDLIVQKEILDSKIRLSGACINEGGTIIASDISAKMGIDACNIGTMGAKPSKLTVGVDDHTNFLVGKINANLKINLDMVTVLRGEISELEKEDQSLHMAISEHAYTQDRTQIKLKDVEKKKNDLQDSGNVAALQKVVELEEQMQEQAKQAENEINKGFERQDALAQEIARKKDRMRQLEEKNRELVDEKKALLEFTAQKKPLPEVKALKKILSGTIIDGPNSFVTINNSVSKCRIMEIKQHSQGSASLGFYEMVITDL